MLEVIHWWPSRWLAGMKNSTGRSMRTGLQLVRELRSQRPLDDRFLHPPDHPLEPLRRQRSLYQLIKHFRLDLQRRRRSLLLPSHNRLCHGRGRGNRALKHNATKIGDRVA